jgi:hypothetical protein
MGIGGGVIQSLANQGAFNASYVNPSMFNASSGQQPNPYQPIGSGYSTAPSGGAGGDLAGRYEIRKMMQGGLAAAAQNMADKGRNGDTELVHMTKGEIKGLQDLALAHGGSLSINPNTGLVEASFLKNLLPMIAGIGLNMMFPGSGALIGLGVGGFEAARTGDIGKGLMAGLGAYGGANIGSALASAAPSTVGTTAANTGISAVETGAGFTPYEQALGSTAQTAAPAEFLAQQPTMTSAEAMKVIGNSGNIAPTAPTLANMGAGAKEIFTNPDAAMAFGKQNIGSIGSAVAPVLSGAMTPKPVDPLDPEKSSGKYISEDFQAYVPAQPNPYYRPRGLGYTGYAAEGGMMPDDLNYANGGMVDPMQRMPSGGLAAIEGMRDGYGPMTTMDGNIPQFKGGGKMSMKEVEIKSGIFKDTNPNTANLGAAEAAEYYVRNAAKKNKVPYAKMPKTNMESLGNIEVGPVKQAAMGGSIGGYSDGGRMLKGPGDGMSDSIPGVIGKRQPARLADGEFVVPADVVSHLGNGSTDAGAKRLYSMMDKIRKARTGTKKQGKQIKPEKYMPA